MRFPLFVLAAAMMVSTPAFADKAKCQAEVKACNDKCGAGDQDCLLFFLISHVNLPFNT